MERDFVLYLHGAVFGAVRGGSPEEALGRYPEHALSLEVVPREVAGERDWQAGVALESKRSMRRRAPQGPSS